MNAKQYKAKIELYDKVARPIAEQILEIYQLGKPVIIINENGDLDLKMDISEQSQTTVDNLREVMRILKLAIVGDKPANDNAKLPYEFDLLYDVKTYEQVDRIARYEGDCSDATPEDLVKLFYKHGLPVPVSLKLFHEKHDPIVKHKPIG